jgi:hypothetical protein
LGKTGGAHTFFSLLRDGNSRVGGEMVVDREERNKREEMRRGMLVN